MFKLSVWFLKNLDVMYSSLQYEWIFEEKCIVILNSFNKSNPVINSDPLSGIEKDEVRTVDPF